MKRVCKSWNGILDLEKNFFDCELYEDTRFFAFVSRSEDEGKRSAFLCKKLWNLLAGRMTNHTYQNPNMHKLWLQTLDTQERGFDRVLSAEELRSDGKEKNMLWKKLRLDKIRSPLREEGHTSQGLLGWEFLATLHLHLEKRGILPNVFFMEVFQSKTTHIHATVYGKVGPYEKAQSDMACCSRDQWIRSWGIELGISESYFVDFDGKICNLLIWDEIYHFPTWFYYFRVHALCRKYKIPLELELYDEHSYERKSPVLFRPLCGVLTKLPRCEIPEQDCEFFSSIRSEDDVFSETLPCVYHSPPFLQKSWHIAAERNLADLKKYITTLEILDIVNRPYEIGQMEEFFVRYVRACYKQGNTEKTTRVLSEIEYMLDLFPNKICHWGTLFYGRIAREDKDKYPPLKDSDD
jgi:hypothetical protein